MDMVNVASTPCGSYSYAAPELFELGGATYDPRKTDAWSMWVLVHKINFEISYDWIEALADKQGEHIHNIATLIFYNYLYIRI